MLEENETPELETVITEAVRTGMMDLRVAMPCRVEKYNKDRQEVDVQPLIKKQYRADTGIVDLPVIPSIPVHFQSSDSGNAYITLPIKFGDLGFVVVCDRSIDAWLSGVGQEVLPNDVRIHDMTDAIFFPGLRPFQNALADVDADNLVIQNDELRMELSPAGKIKIENEADEILLILKDLIQALIDALVVTGIGAQPFTSTTITNIAAIKTRLELMRLI